MLFSFFPVKMCFRCCICSQPDLTAKAEEELRNREIDVPISDASERRSQIPSSVYSDDDLTNSEIDGFHFNEGELQDLRRTFQNWDSNKDDKIDIDELKACLKSFGFQFSDKNAMKMFQHVDTNGDGYIDFVEFLKIVSRHFKELDKEKLCTALFELFDRDHNELIDQQELYDMMKTLVPEVMESDVHQMMMLADSDGDGFISFEEFRKVMPRS